MQRKRSHCFVKEILNSSPSLRSCLFLLLAGVCPGCLFSQSGVVEGRVVIDGEPTAGVEVTFHPAQGTVEGFGVTQSDGKYVLYHGRGSRDFAVGDYKVTLNRSLAGQVAKGGVQKLPTSVTNLDETMLLKQLRPGANQIDFEVSTQ